MSASQRFLLPGSWQSLPGPEHCTGVSSVCWAGGSYWERGGRGREGGGGWEGERGGGKSGTKCTRSHSKTKSQVYTMYIIQWRWELHKTKFKI